MVKKRGEVSLEVALLAAESGIRGFLADPLKAFRFKSTAQRNFAIALMLFREIYLRSGNQAGKTTIGAYCFVAISRGLSKLDGVTLPLLGVPNTGLVLAKGRAMAKESVIKAYRQAVGTWPHHIEKNGGAIEAIWVKPDRSVSDEWHDWSCIRFFVEDGQSLAGMRLDWAHGDEPPKEEAWRELRMRGKANRHFVRAITATPLDKREWKWLKKDFAGCAWPEGKEGRVELRMSVYDNKALGPDHLRAIEEDSKGPLQKAKLYGDYLDLTATNPFDAAGLKRWSERCRPGTKVSLLTPSGQPICYEVWVEPREGGQYFVVADPSAGIEDEQGEHDPGGIVVVDREDKSVVARYNGYIQSRELGWLGARLATEYNRALLIWERNSGYGESFYHGTALGTGREYGNVYIEYHKDSRSLPLSERLGWFTTATTRGTIVGALQQAILEDGLALWSAEAVDSLENVVMKRDGLRPEAGAGSHDEDMIILGLSCHLLETIPLRRATPRPGSEQLVKDLGLRFREKVSPDPFAAP